MADSGAAERGREQWTVGWVAPVSTNRKGGELRRRDEESDDILEVEANVAGYEVEVEVEKDEVEVEVKTPGGSGELEVELEKRAKIGRPFRAVPRMGLAVGQSQKKRMEKRVVRRDGETGVEVEFEEDEIEVEVNVLGHEVEVELEDGAADEEAIDTTV